MKIHWMKRLWHINSLEDILDVIGETVEVIDVMKPIYNFKASNEDVPWKKRKEEVDGTDNCQETS